MSFYYPIIIVLWQIFPTIVWPFPEVVTISDDQCSWNTCSIRLDSATPLLCNTIRNRVPVSHLSIDLGDDVSLYLGSIHDFGSRAENPAANEGDFRAEQIRFGYDAARRAAKFDAVYLCRWRMAPHSKLIPRSHIAPRTERQNGAKMDAHRARAFSGTSNSEIWLQNRNNVWRQERSFFIFVQFGRKNF